MRPDDINRARLVSAGAAFVGAAVSAELAWLHARSISALGVICGGASPHCGWCVSAPMLAALGAGLIVVEWRAQRQRVAAPAIARSRRR